MWQTTRGPRPTPSCASQGPTGWSRTTGTSTGRAAARRPPPCRACSGRSASTRPPRSASTWPSPTSRTCRGAACCRPVLVVRQGRQAHVPVHVTHEDPVEVWIELDPEVGGGRREVAQADVPVEPRTVDGRLVGRATFTLPTDLPLGWHEVVAEGPSASAHSPLVVTPSQLELPDGAAGAAGRGGSWRSCTRCGRGRRGGSATWRTSPRSAGSPGASSTPTSCSSTRCTPPSRSPR